MLWLLTLIFGLCIALGAESFGDTAPPGAGDGDGSDGGGSGDDGAGQVADEADDSAAVDAVLAAQARGESVEAMGRAYEETVAGRAPEQPPSEEEATPPQEQAPAPEPLPDEDQQVLRRFGLEPEDLPAGDRRAKFLENLRQRARHDDQIGPVLAEMRRRLEAQQQQAAPPQPPQQQAQQQQPQQQGQQQAQPAPQQDPWRDLEEIFGAPEDADRVRGAVDATLAGHLAPIQQAIPQLAQYAQQVQERVNQLDGLLSAMLTDRGIEAAQGEMPDGVDLSKPDAREKVTKRAWELMKLKAQQPGFNLTEYNLAHAIPEAAREIFTKQLLAAQAERQKQAAQRAHKGSATPPGRKAGAPPLDDEEAVLDAVLQAQARGATVSELEAIYQGRGG